MTGLHHETYHFQVPLNFHLKNWTNYSLNKANDLISFPTRTVQGTEGSQRLVMDE